MAVTEPPIRLVAFARRTYGDDSAAALAAAWGAVPELALAELQDPERLAAAMLVLGDGDPGRLERAIEIARQDWRDVLVAAGLANGDWPDVLDRTLGPRAV